MAKTFDAALVDAAFVGKAIRYTNVAINGGFWKRWQDVAAVSTIPAIYGQFEATGYIPNKIQGHLSANGIEMDNSIFTKPKEESPK